MKEIRFNLPSSIEVAEALMTIPAGKAKDTVRRLAMAVDLLRNGWEAVRVPPSEVERLNTLFGLGRKDGSSA